MTKRSIFWLLLTGLALSPAGCGDTLKAEGRVILEGNPVAGASVMFIPESDKGLPAYGSTDADGHFSLSTNGASGIRPGRYKVTVTKTEQVPGAGDTKGREPRPGKEPVHRFKDKQNTPTRNLLPAVYSSPQTTPLTLDVAAGGAKNLDITLENKDR